MATPYTSKQWGLWVQPDGPNTAIHYLGCHTLGDVAAPGGGLKDIIRCFRADGSGWDVKGSTRNPPEAVTTNITTLIEETADWLERIVEGANCPFPLYVNGKLCPPYNVFADSNRYFVMERTEIDTQGLTGLAQRDEDIASEQSFEVSAWPPLLRGHGVTTDRITMTGHTQILNDICACSVARCTNECGASVAVGDMQVAVADSSGAAAAEVFFSYDNGATWTAGAADPYAASNTTHMKSVACFPLTNSTERTVVLMGALAGKVCQIFYSDDGGGNWTLVPLASTVAYGGARGGSLFKLDMNNIWCVIGAGAGASEIFYSADGGLTWTEQACPAGDFEAIWFKDDQNGMVVGLADAVATTTDGGATWGLIAAGTGGAGDLNHVTENAGGDMWWVGTDDGDLYYSTDHGVTWTIRTFTGSNAGEVYCLEFATRTQGYMIHSPTAATGIVYRTRNGGLTWEAESATFDGELYSVIALGVNDAMTVGEVDTTVLVLKTHD